MATNQNDDLPEPDRTVSVEQAHLLREQLEYSRENAEKAANEVDEAYQNRRVELTEKYIEDIEGDGLRKSDLQEELERAQEELQSFDEETPEMGATVAERDAARQILRRYFDDGPDVVEVEAVSVTGYENGTIDIQDGSGRAILTFPSEADARATADSILECNGIEDEAARVGMR